MNLMIGLITVILPLNSIQARILEPISGRSLDPDSILPADVLARIHLLSDELELIRLELGKPKTQSLSAKVVDASPREVYFQARTLFIKSNRLLYEQTGNRETVLSAININIIQPFHVWKLVNKSYEQILEVKMKLNINEKISEREYPFNSSPSDVFSQVIISNRKLNNLLKQQFSPGDVYQKINESIRVMAALLAATPSLKRTPLAGPFERRKTPNDVYTYLIKTRTILTDIMSHYGIKLARFQSDDSGTNEKDPNDVYDLASLLVADLRYMHSLKSTAKRPANTYLSGNKTPSDVYQRVSVLNQQLLTLQQLHETNPNWLNK